MPLNTSICACTQPATATLHTSPEHSAAGSAAAAALKPEDPLMPLPRFVARAEKHRPPPSPLPDALAFVKVMHLGCEGQSIRLYHKRRSAFGCSQASAAAESWCEFSRNQFICACRPRLGPSLTRPWRCNWCWAQTRGVATTQYVAPPCCRTAPASRSALRCLRRVPAPMQPGRRVRLCSSC